MPPTLGDRLEHILGAIAGIEQLLTSKTEADIAADRILSLAFERQLEIICEASRHVPADIRKTETTIDWAAMVNLGNLLRHAYHLTDLHILFRIAKSDLPPLKAFVERILAEEHPK